MDTIKQEITLTTNGKNVFLSIDVDAVLVMQLSEKKQKLLMDFLESIRNGQPALINL